MKLGNYYKFITVEKLEPTFEKLGTVSTLVLGIIYGGSNLWFHQEYLHGFESRFLQVVLVPLIFLLAGVLMAYLTRVALMLAFWGFSRGLGGLGDISKLYRFSGYGLLPLCLGAPGIAYFGNVSLEARTPVVSFVLGILLLVSIFLTILSWHRIVMATQQFSRWKAWICLALTAIFTFSVFYLVQPS
ncbi:YIP1 family protein [Calderihabitans maritimus]|uniref:Uncharacterized protein n=1 Tax=Calderihabitans maritimus TaxID=1246530 RepID=A0A1Z5HXN1_9FIRM|nr:YIP1 family protein [Calderihabitans maritimus]GAW94289.1 hypothetical protein KKC1_33980 [Calderihabitans maritimus]